MGTVTPIDHEQSQVGIPTNWESKYTEDDKAKVARIIAWLNQGQSHEPGYANQRSQTKLAKAANVKHSTLNTILSGKYPSPPGRFLDMALEAIERHGKRERFGVRDLPFIETSIYKVVTAACHRAHLYRNFSVVSAVVGTGKTTALKHYALQHANVVLIEADPDMNASVLLTELVEKTGAVVHKGSKYSAGTKAERMRAVVMALKGTDSLLILDEAETVTPQTLEYVRRISDKAGIGVVLAGTEKLKPLLRDPRGRFGQISSRVGMWPKIVEGITEADAHALAQAAHQDDDVELTPEVLDAYWQMCDGSARVLADDLVPGVRDFGLRKGLELTPALIFKVGQEVLGFDEPKARRA